MRIKGEMAMNQKEVILLGTLSPDGTLLLDEKPNLPPGRVKVTVQAFAHGSGAIRFGNGCRPSEPFHEPRRTMAGRTLWKKRGESEK